MASTESSIEVRLLRVDNIYRPGDKVRGIVTVTAGANTVSYSAINLKCVGQIKLQLSPRSSGILDAFYSSIQPMNLVHVSKVLDDGKSGKVINEMEVFY